MDAYWRAANYLSVGQIYLYDNPLLKRPLTLAEKNDLLAYYKAARTEGLNHEAAIRETMTSILVSPDVLYRVDHVDGIPQASAFAKATADKPSLTPLSDYALASRLSYFLWASMPDDKLLAHAAPARWRSNSGATG